MRKVFKLSLLLFLSFVFTNLIAQSPMAATTENIISVKYPEAAIEKAKAAGEILLFEQKTIDLGEIKKGEFIELTFRFLNISDEVIEYSFFDVCSCSALSVDERAKIKPGEEGIIPIKFDSSAREDEEPVSVSFELKNTDKRVNLRYFYSVDYTFSFAK